MENQKVGLLSEQENVKKVLAALQESHGKDTVTEAVFALVKYVDAMEQQYTLAQLELQKMQQNLKPLDQQENQEVFNIVYDNSLKAQQINKQLQDVKAQITEKVDHTVDEVKKHGYTALNKVMDVLQIKPILTTLQENLLQTIKGLAKDISRIEQIGREMGNAKHNIANIGRLVAGGETKAASKHEKNIMAPIVHHLQETKSHLESMEKGVEAAIEGVERLASRTPSVKEQLQSIKETQMKPENTAPDLGATKKTEMER